jgi:predicted acylesterase/phospholipase RssA
MFAAWEAGVWKALHQRVDPSMVVGASAGAWNGWMIAGGASPDELAEGWLDPSAGDVLAISRAGAGIRAKACDLFQRYQPKLRFGLTVTSIPAFRQHLIEDGAITWRHLAATSSIPVFYPPVRIDGTDFVDGGVRGALPLWAAEVMGARSCIALNCLTTWPFRTLRKVIRPRRPSAALRVHLIEPSEPLGSLRDTAVWSSINIRRWIALGENDGNRAAISITM